MLSILNQQANSTKMISIFYHHHQHHHHRRHHRHHHHHHYHHCRHHRHHHHHHHHYHHHDYTITTSSQVLSRDQQYKWIIASRSWLYVTIYCIIKQQNRKYQS